MWLIQIDFGFNGLVSFSLFLDKWDRILVSWSIKSEAIPEVKAQYMNCSKISEIFLKILKWNVQESEYFL